MGVVRGFAWRCDGHHVNISLRIQPLSLVPPPRNNIALSVKKFEIVRAHCPAAADNFGWRACSSRIYRKVVSPRRGKIGTCANITDRRRQTPVCHEYAQSINKVRGLCFRDGGVQLGLAVIRFSG